MIAYDNPDYVPACFRIQGVSCLCRCIWRTLCKGTAAHSLKTPQQKKVPKKLSKGSWGTIEK